ncbi:hypothetical protein HPP92_020779 [Vanilla planifolia]|uniref:SURP motif domain-containing protein n=1 Tax=Vanilla planifolia TaxID=51239 RepID=A0A835Q2Y2_VANPL|nr:hypothetical protein HPP92_020779 [Vanilla planifolia]
MERGVGPERAAEDHYVMREQRPAAEERDRIDRVARFVARDGDLSEAVLLRLLRITKNRQRWGFLAPDHPHHAYYLRRKVSEQCRILRRPSN